MNCGSDSYKPYHFLKECNGKFQMHIYANCFNKLRFLAKFSTKLQFLGKFKDHNEEGNMETGEISQSFNMFFFTLTVCKIHFCIWKYFFLVHSGLQNTWVLEPSYGIWHHFFLSTFFSLAICNIHFCILL